MCFISLDRKKVRLFIDVLFVCSSLLDQEISPFFFDGGRPLVSILNMCLVIVALKAKQRRLKGLFHEPTKPTDKRKKAQLTATPTQLVGCEMILVFTFLG